MIKKIIKTQGLLDLASLPLPNIPASDFNKYYEIQLFTGFDYELNDVCEHNTKGCIFFATKNHLNYIDVQKGSTIQIPFRELDKHYTTDDGRYHSYWLHGISMNSFNITDRAYHLASVIKNELPEVNWNLYGQLLDFKKAVRDKICQQEYLKLRKLPLQRGLVPEGQLILHETEYINYLESNDYCDDAVEKYHLEEMEMWGLLEI